MKRLSIIILSTMLNIVSHAQDVVHWGDWQSWGEQTNGTYRNPMILADYRYKLNLNAKTYNNKTKIQSLSPFFVSLMGKMANN